MIWAVDSHAFQIKSGKYIFFAIIWYGNWNFYFHSAHLIVNNLDQFLNKYCIFESKVLSERIMVTNEIFQPYLEMYNAQKDTVAIYLSKLVLNVLISGHQTMQACLTHWGRVAGPENHSLVMLPAQRSNVAQSKRFEYQHQIKAFWSYGHGSTPGHALPIGRLSKRLVATSYHNGTSYYA